MLYTPNRVPQIDNRSRTVSSDAACAANSERNVKHTHGHTAAEVSIACIFRILRVSGTASGWRPASEKRGPLGTLKRLKEILDIVVVGEHAAEFHRIVAETKREQRIFEQLRSALRICPKGGTQRRNDDDASDLLWPVDQPATLVRFTGPHEMIINTGTVVGNVDTPPAGGCRTSVELRTDNIEDCRDVKGFHQVVTLGNHRRILRQFCELYGIRHIHSPQQSTFTSGDIA